jgi:hypothetical protein
MSWQVLAIYAKSTGKSGTHSSVPDASNIAAVSNIPVQVFEHFVGVQFRAVHAGQAFHMKKFCLLPSKLFLCTLDSTPTITDNELDLKISPQDWSLFRILKDNLSHIIKATKLFSARGKRSQIDLDEYEED